MSFPYSKYRSIKPIEQQLKYIPALDIVFLKSVFTQTSDLWWILREQYKEHPERFNILSLSHQSNNEEQSHFNIGYRVNDKFQQTYHVYYQDKNGKSHYTHITAEGLNRIPICIVEFK